MRINLSWHDPIGLTPESEKSLHQRFRRHWVKLENAPKSLRSCLKLHSQLDLALRSLPLSLPPSHFHETLINAGTAEVMTACVSLVFEVRKPHCIKGTSTPWPVTLLHVRRCFLSFPARMTQRVCCGNWQTGFRWVTGWTGRLNSQFLLSEQINPTRFYYRINI